MQTARPVALGEKDRGVSLGQKFQKHMYEHRGLYGAALAAGAVAAAGVAGHSLLERAPTFAPTVAGMRHAYGLSHTATRSAQLTDAIRKGMIRQALR